MEYVKLGRTGLDVSRVVLGCMTYGDPKAATHDWALDLDASRPFFKQAIEAGINFFDTANVYSGGASEEVVGTLLNEFARREEVVIATKVHAPMRPGPNGGGLSRKAIMTEIDNSLRRLGTDYIDLYQIHRWDPTTPIEETLEALHDVVKAGKARYIGASSMFAWQFAKALYLADRHGWTRFSSMQPHYNLLYREEEREMIPLCQDQGIAVIPWSPLARGRVAKPFHADSNRSRLDPFSHSLYVAEDEQIIDEVEAIAAARGIPMAQVALAWVATRPGITAPIVGATKPQHIHDAVAALNVQLAEDEVQRLEKHYTPRSLSGFSR
ncbi:aldo/keto reductase [Ornithinimicrobium cavernae]|uniref:aldo/keto reductase n=1 Tax=Ornithinimicrobium cavernae TaxID=2666047 RepID=UPI000D690EB4|nr:aldo/keto reductase [Ornithinimicrobium cavernae]